MSQAQAQELDNLEAGGERRIGDTVQHEGESNFVDGSDHLFTMYTEMAAEYDKKMAERWQADADGILVFTGLFSAAVAALISISIQDLQPSSQDTLVFYVANIYQLLAETNGIQVSIPSTLSNPASSFTPPNYAIWVNSLWFLSLAISLTCALLATLLQQWARRYIKITQPRYSPHKRGRIRAFFAEGVDNLHLPWAVEALPALLHLSLFLFFAGLLVFLPNVNHTVFRAVACWVGFCTAAYLSITFMPLFRHDSPYYAPLSSSVSFLATGVLTLLFQLLCWLDWLECYSDSTWKHFDERKKHYRKWLVRGLSKTAEDFAHKVSSAIDGRALKWTLDCSDEDRELERFFAGIPGFCNSKVLIDPIGTCIKPNMERITEALFGLVHRTLTSNLVAPKFKTRRLAICREAMRAASLRTSPQIFGRIINEEWDGLLSSLEFGLFLGYADRTDSVTAFHSQTILSIILPRVSERDESWFRLAADHLGISKSDSENYLAHGDSMSLAISICILRNIFRDHFDSFWLVDATTRWKALELVCRFDIRDTLPTLQHDFCDLWNEIVDRANTSSDYRFRSVSLAILKNVRKAYITLHQGTDSAPTAFSSSTPDNAHPLILSTSYPSCNIPGHHLHLSSHTVPPLVTPGVPSFPIPLPDDGSSQLASGSAQQNIVVSSSSAPQITQINVNQFPGFVAPTSDSIPTGPAANTTIVFSTPSSGLVPHLTSTATPASASPPAQTFPSSTAPPYHKDNATDPSSVLPDVPAFPIAVIDRTVAPSLVPQSAADPTVSRSNHTPLTDSLTTSPVAPPPPTSAWDRGATANGESGALRHDRATGPPSANHVATIPSPHNSVSPQPPPPRSSASIAIAGPSRSVRDAEQPANNTPHSPHGESTSKT